MGRSASIPPSPTATSRGARTTGEPSWPTRTSSSAAFEASTLPASRSPTCIAPWSPRGIPTCSSPWPSCPSCTARRRGNASTWRRQSTPTRSSSRGRWRARRSVRPSLPHRRGPLQLVSHGCLRVEGWNGGVPRGRHVRAALRRDRGRIRSRRAAGREPRAGSVRADRRARGAGSRDAISLAGHRRSARGLDQARRCREARRRPGGAAAPGAADRAAPHPACAAGAREAAAPHRDPGASPRLGRGLGHDRGRERPARERADRGAGAHFHRRAGHGAGDTRVPRPAHRAWEERPPLVSATPYRPGSSPSSSCTAPPPAWFAGPRCSTASKPTPRSAAATSSGSSSTIPALRSRSRRFACAKR